MQHRLRPLPWAPTPRFLFPPPHVQLVNWKPTSAAPASGSVEGERPKRADRYSSKELASKQRLAELVEQHKSSKSSSSKAPKQQGSFRR